MMKRDFRQWAVAALFVAISAFISGAQEKAQRHKELPNFHQVNERLYRGGQPKTGGLELLATMGVKTILNLRGAGEGTNGEEAKARALGMQFVSLPMPNVGRPTDEQIARALEILDDPANTPVFVHCKRGADRTGVLIAAYRIKREGWTDRQAIEEANRHGMGMIQFRKRDFLSDYYKEQKRE
ncbi:MAG: fused DSP-PTPase phosphatase/NAD kinase-like protein [Blastocatellia bacterium]